MTVQGDSTTGSRTSSDGEQFDQPSGQEVAQTSFVIVLTAAAATLPGSSGIRMFRFLINNERGSKNMTKGLFHFNGNPQGILKSMSFIPLRAQMPSFSSPSCVFMEKHKSAKHSHSLKSSIRALCDITTGVDFQNYARW